MRLAAYAGTSTVLATAVVLRAFHERANFYSACVYLSQSNACLMILTNLILLLVCLMMLGLQRLLYGPLRPIEIEQLYEKAWFAITETCLAMTIFREEVGGWFLAMFVSLLAGKVWGWIGEGRVEIVEQQPPANPRLFHARLSFSLLLSLAFDLSLLRYAILTVLRMARPTMMVMFAFEFAVLTISSSSTAARYAISLYELYTIRMQTQRRLEERRAHIREAQEDAQLHRDDQGAAAGPEARAHEVDEADVDVPGWEAKGQWVFYLDLLTDFLKLVIYLSFFSILLTFYGLPIHIMRDVFLTLRSFTKRIVDFLRYRRATKDMNERYPDASAEEIGGEDVCIICREEMRPWPSGDQQTRAPGNAEEAHRPAQPTTTSVDERSRPKKLPCGHILHFGCLRSWLERQQICPTCRRSVMVTTRITVAPTNQAGPNQPNLQVPGHAPPHGHPQAAVAAAAAGRGGAVQEARPPNRGRIINLGRLRIGFGRGNVLQDLVQQMQNGQPGPLPGGNQDAPAHDHNRRQLSFGLGFSRAARPANAPPSDGANDVRTELQNSVQAQLLQLERQIELEISTLRVTADQLRLLHDMQMEMGRLRQLHEQITSSLAQPPATASSAPTGPQYPVAPPPVHVADPSWLPPPGGQPGLPPGLTLPPGWTLMPLHRATSASDGPRPGPVVTHPLFDLSGSGRESSHITSHASFSHPTSMNVRDPTPSSRLGLPRDGARPPSALSQPLFSTDTQRGSTQEEGRAGTTSRRSVGDGHTASRLTRPLHNSEDPSPSSASVPTWATSGSGSFTDDALLGEVAEHGAPSDDQGSSSTASTSRQAKGKGRAVTVEDSVEDVD